MGFDPRLRVIVLTDRTQLRHSAQARRARLLAVVNEALQGGAKAVIVREKDRPLPWREALIADIEILAKPWGCLVLAASEPTSKVDGVHLAASDPFPTQRPSVVGRSTHSLAEVVTAEAEGCDYVTFSPIFATRSKPKYQPVGLDALAHAVGACVIPVVALGGVTAANVGACWTAGASGVAIMGDVMRSADPKAHVADLVGRVASVVSTDHEET